LLSTFAFNFILRRHNKGVLSADADIGGGGGGANVNAAGVFVFDTTSGELKLDMTIAITLAFGPFTIIGRMRKSTECIDAGTVISGSLKADAGKAWYQPRHLVMFTMFTKYFMVVHTK
jgi:hypothetical protein